MPKCDTVCVKNAARSGVLDDLSHRYAGQPNLLSNVHMKWSVLFLFDHGGSYCTEEKNREELTCHPRLLAVTMSLGITE